VAIESGERCRLVYLDVENVQKVKLSKRDMVQIPDIKKTPRFVNRERRVNVSRTLLRGDVSRRLGWYLATEGDGSM
jgi:hypothetical protein